MFPCAPDRSNKIPVFAVCALEAVAALASSRCHKRCTLASVQHATSRRYEVHVQYAGCMWVLAKLME